MIYYGKKDEQILEEFILQITQWAENGTLPECCSFDVNYALELQGKRLEEKNASIDYKYKFLGDDPSNIIKINWQDNRYHNVMACRDCMKTTDYKINGKRKLRQKKYFTML